MNIADITVLEPGGPGNSALIELPPIPEEALISGRPVQKGYRYYQEPESGFRAGIWDCTAFQSKTEPHGVHEFMHLLEGTVTIIHEDGSELEVSKGERFFIPKGTVRSWKQTGPVRKYYMIFPDPSGPAPRDTGSLRAFKVESKPSQKAIDGSSASSFAQIYKDPTGRYSIGIWNSAENARTPEPMAATEMLLPVEGSLTLVGADSEHEVGPGDVVLVPAGAQFGWRVSDPISVIYCAFNGK